MYEIELEDIKIFVNLKPNNKLSWIKAYPNKTSRMLDYLINITKDLKTTK